MQLYQFERRQILNRPVDEVFEFFADAANLEQVTPPFLNFRILTPLPIDMFEGARIQYALSLFGVPLRWTTRITHWKPGLAFTDEQESGPYSVWQHTHEFESMGPDQTIMKDKVVYKIPLGPLGEIARVLFVRRTLHRIFEYRHNAIERLLGPQFKEVN